MTTTASPLIAVRLSDAALCLLSLDDPAMLRERRLEAGGTAGKGRHRANIVRGDRAALLALRTDFGGSSLDGFAAFDSPAAARRTGAAAVRAIDAALAAEPLPVVRPGATPVVEPFVRVLDAVPSIHQFGEDHARPVARAQWFATGAAGTDLMIRTSVGTVHVATEDVASLLQACRATDPRAVALRSRVAFEVCVQTPGLVKVPSPRAIMCVVVPKDAASYRLGRAIVYQLAAKVEALGLSPTWAMEVEVKLADGATAATGVRGWVTVAVPGDDGGANQARAQLHTAAAALLPEIKAEV